MPTTKKTSPAKKIAVKKTAKPAVKKAAAKKAATSPKPGGSGKPTKPALAGAAMFAPGAFDAIDALKKTKADLEAVKRKLRDVDADELDSGQRAQRADQLATVSEAIEVARNALLDAINDALAAALPEIAERTAELAKSLQKLNKAAEVINAVAGVIGVIQRIVTLGG